MSPDHWKCQFDKSARNKAEMSLLILLLVVEFWEPFFFLGFTECKDRVIHKRELFDLQRVTLAAVLDLIAFI